MRGYCHLSVWSVRELNGGASQFLSNFITRMAIIMTIGYRT